MKLISRLVTIAALLSGSLTPIRAQYDQLFYAPIREWAEMSIRSDAQWMLPAGGDTVEVMLFKTGRTPLGTIFFSHGNSGNLSINEPFYKIMTDAGYNVYAWDYPGFGRSTGSPTHAGIAEAGKAVFEKVLEWTAQEPLPLIIYGMSIGTQVSAHLARKYQNQIDALILDSGMLSFTEMAVLSSPEDMAPYVRQYVTSPYSAEEDIIHLEGLPKLIIHGTEDSVVPFAMGEKLYDKAPEPKSFFRYDGEHIRGIYTETEPLLDAVYRLFN